MATLTRLTWDSQMLGMACARLDWALPLPQGPEAVGRDLAAALAAGPAAKLIVAKLPLGAVAPFLLEMAWPQGQVISLGIEVACCRAVRREVVPPPPGVVFAAGKTDPAPFLPLARDMLFSRYYRDPRIGGDRAAALWEASITEHCRGFAQETAVAWHEGKPAGLATIHLENGLARLHIVGVLDWSRGRGVGTRLLQAIIARHGRLRDILVEAHAENAAAIALYCKNGFHPVAQHEILHIWNVAPDAQGDHGHAALFARPSAGNPGNRMG